MRLNRVASFVGESGCVLILKLLKRLVDVRVPSLVKLFRFNDVFHIFRVDVNPLLAFENDSSGSASGISSKMMSFSN